MTSFADWSGRRRRPLTDGAGPVDPCLPWPKWSSVFVSGTVVPNHQLLVITSDDNDGGNGRNAGVTTARIIAPDDRVYDNPDVCRVAENDPNRAETQPANGTARFHRVPGPAGGSHSEYLGIRRGPTRLFRE